jgi:hypothetical protein
VTNHHYVTNVDLLFRPGQSRAAMTTQDAFADIEVRHSVIDGFENS